MNLIPYSRYARTVLSCEKTPFLREFLDEPDTPLDIPVPPSVMFTLIYMHKFNTTNFHKYRQGCILPTHWPEVEGAHH